MESPREGPECEAPWKTMSNEELENQYTPSRWVVRLGAEEALRTYSQMGSEATKRARATRRSLLHIPYGEGHGETLDIYFPEGMSEAWPVCVFFHGGYWQSGRHPGPDGGPGDPEHRVCPEVVSMQSVGIAADFPLIRRSWAGGAVDSAQLPFWGIYLCGHSAGAHLAAMMLLARWPNRGVTPNLRGVHGDRGPPGQPSPSPDVPDGLFLVSGIYDLEPILHTSYSAPLLMTLEVAQRNSPQWHLGATLTQPADPTCRVLVILGQHDSPEFHRQSREFYQTLCRGGWEASFEELRDVDHFEIIWNLTRKDYVLTQMILKTILQEF
nr:kynurenine formamidase isoform X2 [Manis javanica]